MSVTAQETVLAVWTELPDPTDPIAPEGRRTQMNVSILTWRHILEKHIQREQEPWGKFLTEAVRKALLEHPVETSHETSEGQAALARLETEVRRSLEWPLVLLYVLRGMDPEGRPGKTRYRVWGMVLPSGATAYAHQKRGVVELMTCYFPSACCVKKDRGQRWKKTAKMLLWRYCQWSPDNKILCYPAEDHHVVVRPREEKPEYRCQIRFVSWRRWGFLSGEPGSPWRGRLEPWPFAEPAQKHQRQPRRLRPWKTDNNYH